MCSVFHVQIHKLKTELLWGFGTFFVISPIVKDKSNFSLYIMWILQWNWTYYNEAQCLVAVKNDGLTWQQTEVIHQPSTTLYTIKALRFKSDEVTWWSNYWDLSYYTSHVKTSMKNKWQVTLMPQSRKTHKTTAAANKCVRSLS